MKLIIQIPCLNEESTLPSVINDIRQLQKSTDSEIIKKAKIQIINDGSTDQTILIAKKLGVDFIITNEHNLGLAKSFKIGAENAIKNGFDILVNLDGDNQYSVSSLPKLLEKYLETNADIVVGCRPILAHSEFTLSKKILQLVGSAVLRVISKTTVRDAASGFRLYSKNYLSEMKIYTTFSYCMETLIEAGSKNKKVESVDIEVNPKTRESRLFNTNFEYITRQTSTMLLAFTMHQPMRFYLFVATPFLGISLILAIRFLLLVFLIETEVGRTYLPSFIFSGFCLSISVIAFMLGMLAEVLKLQRQHE